MECTYIGGSEMNTFELIENLAEKPNAEIKYALMILMQKKKIDFLDLNAAYVDYISGIEEDRLNQLIEAETCVMESLFYDKNNKKSKGNVSSIQRRLYLLNQSKRFNMDSMNSAFEYDEEKAKSYSWYEKNKDNRF